MLNELELRSGETADAEVAAEEGLAWVPPIDPPVVADESDPEGVRVAAGFGVDATRRAVRRRSSREAHLADRRVRGSHPRSAAGRLVHFALRGLDW